LIRFVGERLEEIVIGDLWIRLVTASAASDTKVPNAATMARAA
jgi:hypothetical protein